MYANCSDGATSNRWFASHPVPRRAATTRQHSHVLTTSPTIVASTCGVRLEGPNRFHFVEKRRLGGELESTDVILNRYALIRPEDVDPVAAIPASLFGLSCSRPAGSSHVGRRRDEVSSREDTWRSM
jgi:hypothetical protein